MEDRTMQERINAINVQASAYSNPYFAGEVAKAQIRCYEEEMKQQIQISYAKTKTEVLADVASKKELQKTKVQIRIGQRVRVLKERFGGDDFFDEAEFLVLSSCILMSREKEEDKLLYVQIQSKTGKKISVFLCFRKMDDRYLNKKFNSAGVRFGFSYEKEVRVRKLFVAELIDMAPICLLPLAHGWYKDGEKLVFAFPEMQTWEEFERYV